MPADSEEAEEFRQRFLREAQAAGILNHPGIVTVFDAGVDEATGLSFIAMEYVEGKSLKELLKSGHMFTYSEVARVGAALASGLDYAHARGVIHRDIKPANILITNQGAIKITDFGVARLESSNLTAEGQFIGTPNYMSPEQVAGTPVDGRSDLFSLGVVVFELLTGTRPFGGNSLTEVSYKIVHEAPPIPSHLRPALPPPFNPILLKLLEKDPSRRYQKGADVARALDALRRVLAGRRRGGRGDRGRRRCVPQRTASAAHTTTRATTVEAPPPEVPPPRPSVWRQQVETRWVAMIIAVAVPSRRGDRGAGGDDRRRRRRRGRRSASRRAGTASWRRSACRGCAARRQPGAAELALAEVWDQAPHSTRGPRAPGPGARRSRGRQSQALRSRRHGGCARRGRSCCAAGAWRDAQERFEEARRARSRAIRCARVPGAARASAAVRRRGAGTEPVAASQRGRRADAGAAARRASSSTSTARSRRARWSSRSTGRRLARSRSTSRRAACSA